MRSQYQMWQDPMQISWPTANGQAHVVYQMFGGNRVRHDDGSWAPSEFTYVERPNDPSKPYFVVECEYSTKDLVPRIIAVQAIHREPGREVRSSDLRSISLESALEAAWLKIVQRGRVVQPDEPVDPASALEQIQAGEDRANRKTFRGLRAQSRRRVTDELLREVSGVYERALSSGQPTKAVKEHFGLATSTASLYVKRAREAGHLPPPARPQAPPRPATQSRRRNDGEHREEA
jgi:hypothetical protein